MLVISAQYGTIIPSWSFIAWLGGEGVQFIGDNISNFSTGEIILLGENLPHNWQCSEGYFREDATVTFEAIVIHFLPAWLGQDFLQLSEALPITKLYERAKRGLLIRSGLREKIQRLMQDALESAPLERVIILLSIMTHLVQPDSTETLASGYAFYQSNEQETIRLNKICDFTLGRASKSVGQLGLSGQRNGFSLIGPNAGIPLTKTIIPFFV